LLDRQIDALKEIGCIEVFDDKASGVDNQCSRLSACLDYLRAGDVLIVLDLYRLRRLASKLIDELDTKDISFKAINSPVGTTTSAGRAFVEIQTAFSKTARARS
jgi:DNA invertase Pin-like site-specific DNA recombinase